MSYITDAVILVAFAREEEHLHERIVMPLPFDRRGQSFRKIDMDGAGGCKFFSSDVYAAAFNVVDGEELEAWFKSLPWGDYDSAFLVWETEGEYAGSASVNWAGDVFGTQP